jgi:N-acetylglucosaminyldiphosphoundecaprenol N-acetyl-beta-D-mannosaminyltransferase
MYFNSSLTDNTHDNFYPKPRIKICGVAVDTYTFDEVMAIIVDQACNHKNIPSYVVTPNVAHLVSLQRDREFRKIYERALLAVPDGVPLLWAAKLLKSSLGGRVNGTDLFEKLAATAAQQGLKVFLLGGRSGAADKASDILTARHPGLDIVGTYSPPYGFENNYAEINRINTLIQDAQPDILFVGLGAPKQEKWIANHYQELGVPVSIGIGVSFEFVAGMVNRAPKWMQKAGLEWLFRLISEPGRLWKRYLLGNLYFVYLVLKQWIWGDRAFRNLEL